MTLMAQNGLKLATMANIKCYTWYRFQGPKNDFEQYKDKKNELKSENVLLLELTRAVLSSMKISHQDGQDFKYVEQISDKSDIQDRGYEANAWYFVVPIDKSLRTTKMELQPF